MQAPSVADLLQSASTRQHAGKAAIAAACAYEIAALWTGTPTITELVKRGLDHRLFRLAVWLGTGAAIDHFWND